MRHFILLASLSLAVTACAQHKDYHYWQKTDSASALYLTGPKAQQVLEQDISTCVHEIVELAKLANVREGSVSSLKKENTVDHPELAQEMANLPSWETPEYIRDLRVDHSDYHDFDSCMASKGWTRVKYVHPKTEHVAKTTYETTAEYSARPSAKKSIEKKKRAIQAKEIDSGYNIDDR